MSCSQRPSVAGLRALKGKRQILTVHVDTAAEAAAAAEVGCEMFTFEVDNRLAAVRAAAPNVFLQPEYKQGHMASEKIAIRDGFKAMEAGICQSSSNFAPLHGVGPVGRTGIRPLI